MQILKNYIFLLTKKSHKTSYRYILLFKSYNISACVILPNFKHANNKQMVFLLTKKIAENFISHLNPTIFLHFILPNFKHANNKKNGYFFVKKNFSEKPPTFLPSPSPR